MEKSLSIPTTKFKCGRLSGRREYDFILDPGDWLQLNLDFRHLIRSSLKRCQSVGVSTFLLLLLSTTLHGPRQQEANYGSTCHRTVPASDVLGDTNRFASLAGKMSVNRL